MLFMTKELIMNNMTNNDIAGNEVEFLALFHIYNKLSSKFIGPSSSVE
jgi:hypothetical protein